MKFKVETVKDSCTSLAAEKGFYSWVVIKRLTNTTVGAPRYECTVILINVGDETLRGAYTFKKIGYYSGEQDLADEATNQLIKELGL